jgi:hypothetical protein
MTYLQSSSERSSMLVSSMLLLTISEKVEASHGLTRGWGDEKSRRSYKTGLSNLASGSAPTPSSMKDENVRHAHDFRHRRIMNNKMDNHADSWGYYTEGA